MKYDSVQPINRSDAARILASTNKSAVCSAMVSLAFHDPDWRWVQDQCLAKLRDKDMTVAGVAATCLGHLARIHHCLDVATVIPALELARRNASLRGRVEDALEDIRMYSAEDRSARHRVPPGTLEG